MNGSSLDCDQHYVVVATKLGIPGAHASCVDDPEWLADWAVEQLLDGSTLQRVTCNKGHAMLMEYVAWCDAKDAPPEFSIYKGVCIDPSRCRKEHRCIDNCEAKP